MRLIHAVPSQCQPARKRSFGLDRFLEIAHRAVSNPHPERAFSYLAGCGNLSFGLAHNVIR
jgi:hypothetical protein